MDKFEKSWDVISVENNIMKILEDKFQSDTQPTNLFNKYLENESLWKKDFYPELIKPKIDSTNMGR